MTVISPLFLYQAVVYIKTPLGVTYEVMIPLLNPFAEPVALSIQPPLDIQPRKLDLLSRPFKPFMGESEASFLVRKEVKEGYTVRCLIFSSIVVDLLKVLSSFVI